MHIMAQSQGSWVGGQAELQGEVNLSDWPLGAHHVPVVLNMLSNFTHQYGVGSVDHCLGDMQCEAQNGEFPKITLSNMQSRDLNTSLPDFRAHGPNHYTASPLTVWVWVGAFMLRE